MVDHRESGADKGPGRGAPGRRSAVLGAAVALSLLGAGLLGVTGAAARTDTDTSRAEADEIEIIELRSQLRRVHLHEANVMMLQLFGAATAADLEAARDAREAARQAAVERVRVLAGGDGVVATEALFLYDLLTNDGLQGEREGDPSLLFDTGRAAARDSRPPTEQLDDQALALYDLMRTDAAGSQVLNDAMDAAYTLEQPVVPEIMRDYVGRSEPYIRSDGGYLGPDPEQPLVDSYVYDATATVAHPGVARVSDRIAGSRLWEYDQWIRSWQEGTPGPAPIEIDELVAEVDAVERDVREIVDESLSEARETFVAETRSAERRALVCFVLAALLGLVGVGALAATVRRRWRAVRHAAERTWRDPLTGVGNRHALDDQVAPLVTNPSYGAHLVAAVDMDRFKMINDTWGHAVGDRVLVEVARRLTGLVEHWRGSAAGATGAVIRMGGDEFLLTLHSRTTLDETAVRADLEEIRNSVIAVGTDDEAVSLMFSVGIATAVGPCELDDLVRAADLAAYEEKAVRARSLPDRRRTSTIANAASSQDGGSSADRPADVSRDTIRDAAS